MYANEYDENLCQKGLIKNPRVPREAENGFVEGYNFAVLIHVSSANGCISGTYKNGE